VLILQYGRWGEDWQNTAWRFQDMDIARKTFRHEADETLTGFECEGKIWFRVVDEQGAVLELWRPLPYVGSPYIAMMSENPFNELQEDYGFEDAEMIELCQRYLKAKVAA
jgi:hypothetical protein